MRVAEDTQAVAEAEAGAELEADHTRGLGAISRWKRSRSEDG